MKKIIVLFLLILVYVRCSTYEEEKHLVYDKHEDTEILTLASGARVEKSDNSLMTQLERDNLERKLNGEPPIWDGNGKSPMQ